MNALEVIGGALLGGKVVEKVLGPTAEYLGAGVKTFAEKRVGNVRNIFANAHKKLGDRIDSPGAVPPRVLAGILNDAVGVADTMGLTFSIDILDLKPLRIGVRDWSGRICWAPKKDLEQAQQNYAEFKKVSCRGKLYGTASRQLKIAIKGGQMYRLQLKFWPNHDHQRKDSPDHAFKRVDRCRETRFLACPDPGRCVQNR
jgi:hypothetical protein